MALTVESNLITISTCDADDWDLGVGALDDDFKKEGTACLGIDTDIETNRVYKTIAQADWTGRHLYVWLMCMTAPTLDLKSNGGMQLILVDASGNEGYWYVAGVDTYSGGWRRFVISADSTPDANSGSPPNKTQITKVGVGFKCVAKSKLSQNSFWDYVQYDTAASRGVKITGGAATPRDWDEVFLRDDADTIGLIRKEAGIFYLQGTMQFGDPAAGDLVFEDVNQILVYEDVAGSSDFHKISVVGNAGTTTSFKLGSKLGSVGIQGCVLKSVGDVKFRIVATDPNIDALGLYGCIFLDAGPISLPPNDSGRECLNCNFSGCGKVTAGTCKVQFCNFISPVADAILISDDPHFVTDCSFINCVNGVEIDTVGDGSYDFNALKFINTTYHVNNTSGSTLEVANGNGSNASMYTGSTVNFTSSAQLTITVKNEQTPPQPIVGAFAYIDDQDEIPYIMNKVTNGEGVATVAYTGAPIANARWRVRKYGYRSFKQLIDIGSDDIDLPVTLVVDPQQS